MFSIPASARRPSARFTAAMETEPAGCTWAKKLPSALTNTSCPALPMEGSRSVAGYGHVGFKVGCRPAVFIFPAKAEPVRLPGFELRKLAMLAARAWRNIVLPYHAISPGKWRDIPQ